MAISKPRTPCSRCKQSHTDNNRVLWWTSKGEAHGPLTRFEDDIALCEECASEVYQGRITVQSSVQVRILRLSEQKEFAALCKDALEIPTETWQRWLKDSVILIAQIKDDFVGMCVFSGRPEVPNSKTYFIDFETIWVAKQWRGFGVGKKLFDEFIERIAQIDIHYVKPVEKLSADVQEFLWDKVFDTVEGFNQCYIWKDAD